MGEVVLGNWWDILFGIESFKDLFRFRKDPPCFLRRAGFQELLFGKPPDVKEPWPDPFKATAALKHTEQDGQGGFFRLHEDHLHGMLDESKDQLGIMSRNARKGDAGVSDGKSFAAVNELVERKHQITFGVPVAMTGLFAC